MFPDCKIFFVIRIWCDQLAKMRTRLNKLELLANSKIHNAWIDNLINSLTLSQRKSLYFVMFCQFKANYFRVSWTQTAYNYASWDRRYIKKLLMKWILKERPRFLLVLHFNFWRILYHYWAISFWLGFPYYGWNVGGFGELQGVVYIIRLRYLGHFWPLPSWSNVMQVANPLPWWGRRH